MALKTEKTDTLEYLNKLCEDSGIEIVLPNLIKSKKEENKKDKKQKEDKK